MPRWKKVLDDGWLLIEAMVALTVVTVGVLGFLFTFQASFRATRELGSREQAQAAIESAVEVLQESNFGTLYASLNNATLPAPGLVGTDGNPAVVRMQFDISEPTLPPQYGPVADIDGDGARTSTNCSTSYVLLPARLTVNYQMSYGPERMTMYVVLAP